MPGYTDNYTQVALASWTANKQVYPDDGDYGETHADKRQPRWTILNGEEWGRSEEDQPNQKNREPEPLPSVDYSSYRAAGGHAVSGLRSALCRAEEDA